MKVSVNTPTLVIKLGALGDMIQSISMFGMLRQQYGDNLTLLTTLPFADLAQRSGYFKKIICDNRQSITASLRMIRNLRSQRFNHIIDLQNVDRTRFYKILLTGSYTKWITSPRAEKEIHPFQRFRTLCKVQNWPAPAPIDLTMMVEPLSISLPSLYAIIVAGASNAHGGKKKWPQKNYEALCNHFITKGITPVLIGSKNDHLEELVELCGTKAINLIGQTNLYQLITLGMNAVCSIGNDTGPQLMIASSGCPTITLFSKVNPPEKGGAWPWDQERHLNLYKNDLNELSVGEVNDLMATFI